MGAYKNSARVSPARYTTVITCEHAGFEIPPLLSGQLTIPARVLTSHQGYDRGAREIALALGEELECPPVLGTISRLVVDFNRSETFPGIFSRYARSLDDCAREEILQQHYRPFRDRVRAMIAEPITAGEGVLHLSVHTFTPVMRGERRTADIGLLFDPARTAESKIAEAWGESLTRKWPRLQVKMNYPYLGTDDGHTTSLRTVFPDPWYAGIELEVNHKWAQGSARQFAKLIMTLRQSLAEVIAPFVY